MDYSDENISDNEDFPPNFLQFEPENSRVLIRAKETKHIPALPADLLYIRIGNLDWCKCRHYKKKAREIDCL